MICGHCGKELTRDEIGLSRRLISRAAATCYCLNCLSADYKVSIDQLLELIVRFRASGCTLFS